MTTTTIDVTTIEPRRVLPPGRGTSDLVSDADSAASAAAIHKRAGVPLIEVLEAINLRPAESQSEARTSNRRRNPSC